MDKIFYFAWWLSAVVATTSVSTLLGGWKQVVFICLSTFLILQVRNVVIRIYDPEQMEEFKKSIDNLDCEIWVGFGFLAALICLPETSAFAICMFAGAVGAAFIWGFSKI